MHPMGTEDTPDETSWKYYLNFDFVCKPRRILRQHIDVSMLLKLSVKIVIRFYTKYIFRGTYHNCSWLNYYKSKVEVTCIDIGIS